MERLMEDALHVQTLLPWIESNEDIINFMRRIPLDKSHLRHQLTIRYFLNLKDSCETDLEKQIEDDAREIVIAVLNTSYQVIKKRLAVLGNIPNRKEVVLRQLLHENCNLDMTLKEIELSTKKRKSELPHENIIDLDSSDNTSIKNKICKREEQSLATASSSVRQEACSPKVVSAVVSEAPSSSTVITSSTSHSDAPDSTVPSTSGRVNPANGQYLGFLGNSDVLLDIIDSMQPSTSGTVTPSQYGRESLVPLINNNDIAFNNYSNNDMQVLEISETPVDTSKRVINKTSTNCSSNNNSSEHKPKFDLIKFLQELTPSSEAKIIKTCKKLNINLNKRPGDQVLTYIINTLFEDTVGTDSDNSESNSDTQEYQLSDYIGPNVSQNTEDTRSRNPINTTPVVKQFKLKEPVLTLKNKPDETVVEDLTFPTWKSSASATKVSVIKPPKLTLRNGEPNVIPAMPQQFLNRIDLQNASAESILPEPLSVPVDLSSPKVTDLTNNNSIQDVSAAGSSTISNQINRVVDEKLVLKLFEMFPEACPRYIRDICNGKQWDEFDDIVSVILSNDAYPRRPQRIPSPAKEVDLEEQYEIIKELLPDADPAYLRMECEKYINDEKGLKQFINQAMELKNYPTMKEYLRMQQLSAQKKQYTTEFNVENFVQLFPDPKKTFKDPNRTIQVGAYAIHYLNAFFRNRYDKLPARTIQNILSQNNYKILASNKAFKELVKKGILMKSRRKITPLPEHIQNIPILQELAYLTHKKEIKAYIQEKKKKEKQERLETKKLGLMQTCQCCFDEEIMPNDTFSCPNGCSFCRDCIKQSCEVALGEGKTNFSCLSDCTAEFTLQTLQNALPPKMFSKLAQKKAIAEVKAAGIPELETCPFCDFATIPNETDKIFRCLNADCMKESCRGCKQPNHVPLKCEEVEVDEAVKARTYVENKMTEALLRECWKCHTKFYKEEGCNKMTCSCGAQMCYICKAPVTNYSHFNGIGGDKFNLCPLYSDTNSVNEQNVLQAAASAKAEIDPSKLKVDPTTDIKEHYKNRGKQLPREPHMDLLRVNNPGHLNHHHRPRHRRRENYFMHFGEILNQQQMNLPQNVWQEIRQNRNQRHHF